MRDAGFVEHIADAPETECHVKRLRVTLRVDDDVRRTGGAGIGDGALHQGGANAVLAVSGENGDSLDLVMTGRQLVEAGRAHGATVVSCQVLPATVVLPVELLSRIDGLLVAEDEPADPEGLLQIRRIGSFDDFDHPASADCAGHFINRVAAQKARVPWTAALAASNLWRSKKREDDPGMKILAFSASVRNGSLNTKLIKLIARKLTARGVEIDLADFHEFDMPLYDGNLEASDGIPAGALKLAERIRAADAMVVSSPEFNHGVAAPLKNALDWISRVKPPPTVNKPYFIASAAPSMVGGWRGVIALMPSLTYLGAWVSPDTFCLAQANKAFDEEGGLVDEAIDKMLDGMMDKFVTAVRTLDFG